MAEPRSNDTLFSAVERGDEAAVRSFLPHCRNLEAVDRHNSTALHIACREGHHRIAEILLDHGASVDTRRAYVLETALHMATQNGWTNTVALLLSRGADVRAVNISGRAVLHSAAIGGREKMIKLLLRYCPDSEVVNADGDTPLSHVCRLGNSEVANELIRSGANIHWVSTEPYDRGYTIVHFAARENLADTVQLLLDLKAADVNAVGEDGRTPLHMACYKGSLNAARCLLENGAQVNYSCMKGETALHLAAQEQSLELVELLLKYKADVNAENNNGQTPLGFAVDDDSSNREVIQFFKKQLLKMKEQNLFISERNLKDIFENDQV